MLLPMNKSVRDILKILEEIAPSVLSEEWDNPGLQVGDPCLGVKNIMLALDPTLSALRHAMEMDAQILLTHHPLIFKPLFKINKENYPANIVFEAIKNNIAIISMHTNLDAAKKGINSMLADLFSLNNRRILLEREDLDADGTGFGRIGELPEKKSLSEMVTVCKDLLETGSVRVVGDMNRKVYQVAVAGGSGSSMVKVAHQKGADLLITGDVSHDAALEAKFLGLALIDAGHFHTERAAFRLFGCSLIELMEKSKLHVGIDIYAAERPPMASL